MLEIKVRKVWAETESYAQVNIETLGPTEIDLGMLDVGEREALIEHLRNVCDELEEIT